MKQTKNHKLNLIEMSDTFSTGPLNENMEAIDGALKAASDTAAAISSRVVALEAKHIVVGTYRGPSTGSTNGITITLGFKPRAVMIGGEVNGLIVNAIGDVNGGSASLTDDGFRVVGMYASANRSYNYIAFA